MNTRPGYSMPSPARSGPKRQRERRPWIRPVQVRQVLEQQPAAASADCCASTRRAAGDGHGHVDRREVRAPRRAPAAVGRPRPQSRVRHGRASGPVPTCSPVATTCSPARGVDAHVEVGGRQTSTSRSGCASGGSSAQPRPGTHGSTGKNEPSRSALPCCEMRSASALAAAAARTAWRSSAVAAGRQPPAASPMWSDRSAGRPRGAPSTRTGPVARRAPSARRLPPFAHSRNTIRSVAMSGRERAPTGGRCTRCCGRLRSQRESCSGAGLRVGRRVGWPHGRGRARAASAAVEARTIPAAAGRRHQRQHRCQRRTREAHDLGIGSRGRAVKRGRSAPVSTGVSSRSPHSFQEPS